MNTSLLVLVALLLGGLALAFCMDWLGLWVSKEDMRKQIDQAKERTQGPGRRIGDKVSEAGAAAREEAGTEVSDTRRFLQYQDMTIREK